MRRNPLIKVLLTIMILALAVASFGIYFESPPLPLDQLDALPVGVTKAEVQRRFGTPDKTYRRDSEWVYARPLAWPIVYIFFDENGLYAEYVYDH